MPAINVRRHDKPGCYCHAYLVLERKRRLSAPADRWQSHDQTADFLGLTKDQQIQSVSRCRKKSDARRLRIRYGNLNELTKWRNARG